MTVKREAFGVLGLGVEVEVGVRMGLGEGVLLFEHS